MKKAPRRASNATAGQKLRSMQLWWVFCRWNKTS